MATHWLLLAIAITLCGYSKADSGDEIPSLADAVELLKIEDILSMNGRIAEKDVAKATLEEENEALRQIINDQRQELMIVEKVQLAEREELEKTLRGSRVLAKVMMNALLQSEQMKKEREAAIVIQTDMVEKALAKNEACKHENADNSKVLSESQETISIQNDTIGKLKNILHYTEALNSTYHELEALKSSEDNCDLATFVSTMSNVLSNQENEIEDLSEVIENDKKIKNLLESINTELIKEHKTNESSENTWEILENYQTLIERQSRAIRDLSAMASYNADVNYDFHHEEDESGNLVSASSCQCIPEIGNHTQISTVLANQGQKIVSMWTPWEYHNCFEWVTSDNKTFDCGRSPESMKTRTRYPDLAAGSWEPETERVYCSPHCAVFPLIEERETWSNWTQCEDLRQRRWTLRLAGKEGVRTEVEERDCLPQHPQCERDYTVLSEDWRKINYSSSSRSPYKCDQRMGFNSGWYRFIFNGKDNGRIPTEAAPKRYMDSAKTCMTYTTAWQDGSNPEIGDPPKNVTMKFERESGSYRDTISAKVVACGDDKGPFFLYYLSQPDECDLAWCATTDH